MTRIGMMLAVVGLGGVLLGTGEARACAAHATGEPSKKEALAQAEAAVESDTLLTAKCQCSSAADCTCKKGSCECPKCKKPKRDVVESLQGQSRAPESRKVRDDASAGIFL
jgi:hypothetical protein